MQHKKQQELSSNLPKNLSMPGFAIDWCCIGTSNHLESLDNEFEFSDFVIKFLAIHLYSVSCSCTICSTINLNTSVNDFHTKIESALTVPTGGVVGIGSTPQGSEMRSGLTL